MLSGSGNGRRRGTKGAAATDFRNDEPAARTLIVDDIDVVDRLDVLADEEAWTRAGSALRRCDPKRYLALLKAAEDICSIHRDPVGAVMPSNYLMFMPSENDDFD